MIEISTVRPDAPLLHHTRSQTATMRRKSSFVRSYLMLEARYEDIGFSYVRRIWANHRAR